MNSNMDHVAILNNKKLLEMILSGEKSIESRWYVHRTMPWNILKPKDNIYFKLSGKPVMAKAVVEKVLQFEGLNEEKACRIIEEYGPKIGITRNDSDWFKGKNYCILAFLENPEPVKPFNIDKKGFGNSAAWLYVKDIDNVRI